MNGKMIRIIFFVVVILSLFYILRKTEFQIQNPKMISDEPTSESVPSGWKKANLYPNSICIPKEGSIDETSGDFDGDGKVDKAKLLSKDDNLGLGVWVWLSTKQNPILASEVKEANGNLDVGISIAKPGTYKTACGKEYWECKNDELPELILKNAAIDFFTCESANRYLYWDPLKDTFLEMWMSD